MSAAHYEAKTPADSSQGPGSTRGAYAPVALPAYSSRPYAPLEGLTPMGLSRASLRQRGLDGARPTYGRPPIGIHYITFFLTRSRRNVDLQGAGQVKYQHMGSRGPIAEP